MEKINDSFIHETDIESCIYDFCEKYNIQDMTNETQNRYNALLSFICKRLFRDTNILKLTKGIHNEYDIDKVHIILEIYIDLCDTYSKEISINGFCRLTDIPNSIIYEWSSDNNILYNRQGEKLRYTRSDIYKRLIAENERSNSDLLGSSPRTLGIVARLNHVHGWSSPYARQDTGSKALATRENIVQIDDKNRPILPPVDN